MATPWTIVRIAKIFTFDASHTLEFHDGKCRRLHGHTYKAEVVIRGVPLLVRKKNPQSGMVLDYGILKRLVEKHVLDYYDHVHLDDVLEYPTAERIVQTIFDALAQSVAKALDEVDEEFKPVAWTPPVLERLRLWETPTSWAEVEII